jgi:hypothetical protein
MNAAATGILASEARVAIAKPARYLTQLCKHFGHRLPTTQAAERSRIEFPAGLCLLEAQGDVLLLRIEANEEPALAQLEEVVARHLERFAFRDKPEVGWARR